MLDKFLVLLERFVVAHELIAKTNAERMTLVEGSVGLQAPLAEKLPAKELPVEGEEVIDAPAKKPRKTKPAAKPEPEPEDDDLADEPKGADIAALRNEIKHMAKHVAAGDSDKCADLFDELLEDYKVRTVTKLPDSDVEEFHAEAKKLVAKYYEIED